MLRILNSEPDRYSLQAKAILNSLGSVDEKNVTRTELLHILPNYDVLLVRLRHRIDREIIQAGLRLKIIVSPTTGLDHIDCQIAAKQGIVVLSLQGEVDFLNQVHATAEHTWALLLSLIRRIPAAYANVLADHWQRDEFQGQELQGKILGVVGLGRLGKKIAHYGNAFGMAVHAYDPYHVEFSAPVTRHFTLEDLLREADIVSLHVPLNASTERLIAEKELGIMKKGAILVNTARGKIVDEFALIRALESSQLSGAALDVVATENTAEKSPLIEYAKTHSHLLIKIGR